MDRDTSLSDASASLHPIYGVYLMVRAKSHFSILLTASMVAVSIGFMTPRLDAAEYTLMPSPQTVHIGHFSPTLKPILTIESGDTVTIETATQIDPPMSTNPASSHPASFLTTLARSFGT